MPSDRDIFVEAARLTQAGTPFVLITVIATKGSSPRDPGAKMIWQPPIGADADLISGLTGTVGGGQFELLVTESAARVFASRSTAQERFVLAADAEQCCGGVMDVFLEYCGQRQRLVVFGAGHVSESLADVLTGGAGGSPLELVIVDDRPEWNSAARFPTARRILNWEDGVRLARSGMGILPMRPTGFQPVTSANTLACVMTCSHDTDFDLLRDLLADSTSYGATPAFLGLIGSKSKRACLFGRLISSGIPEDRVKSIHCPIGIGDTGKEPRMVAISIAAQVLLEAKRLNANGGPGASPGSGAIQPRTTPTRAETA